MAAERAKKQAPPATPSVLPGAPLPNFDKLIHERVRLGIVSALAVAESLGFNELKQQLQLSDGNLSVHARKLEDAGYVLCEKGYEGRKPSTRYRITPLGREALEAYLGHMEALILAMRQS